MKDIKELKKIYFNLYKSSDILGEELKGYFYSYIYWILSGIFSNSRYNLEVSIAEFINGFINYSLYIINDKYIIYSPVFYDLESKCFKKVEDRYRIKKEGGFAIAKFTNKIVRKFFNFFMKNIDKFRKKLKFQYKIDKTNKKITLIFGSVKKEDLGSYINSLKKYLKFLNILYSYISKNLNVKIYFLYNNKIEDYDKKRIWKKFKYYQVIFSNTLTPLLKVVYDFQKKEISEFYDYKKSFSSLIFNLGEVIQKDRENISIFENYKRDLKEVVNLINNLEESYRLKVFLLKITLKIWCDVEFWNKYLKYKKKVIQQEEFTEEYYCIEKKEDYGVETINYEISVSFHRGIPFFRGIENEIFGFSGENGITLSLKKYFKKYKLILEIKVNKEVLEDLQIKSVQEDKNSGENTLIFYDGKSNKKVYELKITDMKVIEVIG